MKNKYLIAILIASSSILAAQENEKAVEGVTIHARTKVIKEQEEFKKNAQATENLSSYELKRNNPAMIEQALNTVAGVQMEKRTIMGGQRIILRGYGNDQKFNNWGIKMYWNNIPLTNADGVTILDDVNFNLINHIEVIKGPASTVYGGGTGGVVRFYTRPETQKGHYISQDVMAGSFGSVQSSTGITSVGENYSINANYGHIQADGYRPHGKNNKNFYSVTSEIKLNKNQKLSLLASHGNSLEQVSGQISYEDYYNGVDNGNFAYIRRGAKTKFITTRVGIGHTLKIKENLSNSTTIFYSGTTGDRIAAGAYETSSSPNYGIRSVFIYSKDLKQFKSQTEFGVEHLQSRALITNYRFKSVKNTEQPILRPIYEGSYFKFFNTQTSIFAVEKVTYKPWDLLFLAGVSINKIAYNRQDLLALPGLFVVNGVDLYKGQNLSFNKKFEAVATPHFALQKIWKKQIFNISYSEGYNAPSSATSYISGLNKTNDQLLPERAKMWDFSVQGLLLNTALDYQLSVFNIDIKNKLTQLRGVIANAESTPYTYWANTGDQSNKGMELSIGYVYEPTSSFLKRIQPFASYTYNDFKYKNFSTYLKEANKPAAINDYEGKKVVGVPKTKFTLGLDFSTNLGLYWQNTFNYMGSVYTDFANSNKVKSFGLLNSKIGYKRSFRSIDFDVFVMGNNLTNQINYTFLFYGNNINDTDSDNQYNNPAVFTDINPGPKKAYFFAGLNLKYHF